MKDITKLEKLREKNPNCLKYLVVMDRVVKKRSIDNIRKKLKKKKFFRPVILGIDEVITRA